MNKLERQQYYMKMRRKRITGKEICNALGFSESLLSRFWNDECNMHPDKVGALKRYIDETEKFKFVKVLIN
jgi:transcriptional regulator with XRE-family HTH domain